MPNISKAERARRAAEQAGQTAPVNETPAVVLGDASPATPQSPADAVKTGERPVLVKMTRDSDGMQGDVHPIEVENYLRGGWRLV